MYKQRVRGWSQHVDFMTLDILCIFVSLLAGFLLVEKEGVLTSRFFWSMVVETVLADLIVMIALDTYHSVLHHTPWEEINRLFSQTGHVIIILLILRLLSQAPGTDLAKVALYSIPLYVLLCFVMRQTYKGFLKKRHHILNRHSMLIALETSQISSVIPRILRSNYGSYRFSGIAVMGEDPSEDDAMAALRSLYDQYPEVGTIPVVATADTLVQYLTNNWVDEVYLDVPPKANLPVDLINDLMQMGITIHTALSNLDDLESRHKNVEWICGHLTITTSLGYITGRDVLLKRTMDILGGLVGSLFTVILTIPVGLAIWLSDPGPIFFSQTRIGENGKKFKLYKFRSMYMDAEARKAALVKASGQEGRLMFKLDDDPRIIGSEKKDKNGKPKGVGNFIRNTSLDEFPQFWNVLIGNMSLVGTRPPTVDEWEKYAYHHRARLSFKPGITGLWQVSGRSKITDFEEVVRLDTEYIEHWDLGLHLRILLKTVTAVLRRDGAM